MSQYYFGVNNGSRLSKREIARRSKAAKKHDAEFHVSTGNSGHCVCGYGCRLDTCPIKRSWFSCRNLGEPFNSATARAVESELGM